LIKLLKKYIKKLPIAFTKNQRYDAWTDQIIKKVCQPQSNSVDVGCHKGEVLETILKAAPNGHHYCFEPLPDMFENLQKNFADQPCTFHEIALSDSVGETTFNYVVSNPSYSGIKKRKYDKPNEKDTQITVQMDLLDNIIPLEKKIDFIKIDVEGAEFLVMKGASKIIDKWKPVVVFEHGIGGADIYGIRPESVFDFYEEKGMKISLLNHFLKGKSAFSKAEFVEQFDKGLNYYFVASEQ